MLPELLCVLFYNVTMIVRVCLCSWIPTFTYNRDGGVWIQMVVVTAEQLNEALNKTRDDSHLALHQILYYGYEWEGRVIKLDYTTGIT